MVCSLGDPFKEEIIDDALSRCRGGVGSRLKAADDETHRKRKNPRHIIIIAELCKVRPR